jgi:hypothetical protein
MRGTHMGTGARAMMFELIANREKAPNCLEFSNVIRAENDGTFIFLFDSKGQIARGYPYEGFNALIFVIEAERIISFREYFGDVNPEWFQS